MVDYITKINVMLKQQQQQRQQQQQQQQQRANKWPLTDNGRSPYLERIANVLRGKFSENEITQLARVIESAAFNSVCYITLCIGDRAYCYILLQAS